MLLKGLNKMKIYKAYYDSRRFVFEAFSTTESKACAICLEALKLHAKQYNLESDWFMFGDLDGIECTSYDLNTPYRDGETL